MGNQSFLSFQAKEPACKGKAMNEAKEQGKELDQRQVLLLFVKMLKNIIDAGGGNS